MRRRRDGRRARLAVLMLFLMLVVVPAGPAAPAMTTTAQDAGDACTPGSGLARVGDLPEGSGIAVGRRVPGRLWMHNDSGPPVLVALDPGGTTSARVGISGAAVDDWEAIAVGPCPAGSCLYIGDIGDNNGRRERITVYRVPEPDAGASTAAVDAVFHARYPDGAQDAEALLVSPDGTLLVATKGRQRPVALYRFPPDPQPGATVQLQRIGQPLTHDVVDAADRITDGAMSPDGEWIALRTLTTLTFYRTADVTNGYWRAARRVDLSPLREPQGEGVALGEDGAVYLVGEGGGGRRAGTLTRFTCDPAAN